MIYISRQYLCVCTDEKEREEVSVETLKQLITEKPANLAYFETGEGLYGIVSFGDIIRSDGKNVKINRNFTSVCRQEYMKAREVFKKALMICEIPVTENGKLIGEYHRFDDELILDRARDPKYNAYTQDYFRNLRNVAIVRPLPFRDYKAPYFMHLKDLLDRYGVEYTEISFGEMLESLERFETFIMTDEQEKRGAYLSLYLHGHNDNMFYKFLTYNSMLAKLESSEVVDYNDVFERFCENGVDVVLLTASHLERDYVQRTRAEIRKRFPRVDNNINQLIAPYEKDFFDDLADQREYMDCIEKGYFVIEKDKQTLRLQDIEGEFVNVKNGERRTTDQPEDYTRTIFFFGPCLVIGAYVADEYTIESYLQRMINKAGYKVKVVNCGCWGGNVATVGRMISTLIREGDVIVAMLEDLVLENERFKHMDLWDVLEANNVPARWMLDVPYHVNHHVSELYAQRLYDMIFTPEYEDLSERRPFIKHDLNLIDNFFIQKYFHGVDLDKYNTVACCVFNGNPFTNGHRYLIETAAKETDHVYLLSVREDSSLFSFGERYAMAVEAVRDLDNVTVIPSGLFIGNVSNFPAYYAKVYVGDTRQQAESHVDAFISVAKLLHVTHRYIGEEPLDPVTNEINLASKRLLPKNNIQTVILKRKEEDGKMITGTYIRELAADNDPTLDRYVPPATADIIRCETINKF